MSGITSDLLRWLQINQPPDREGRILHGDYKIDNLVFHPDEPRVAAVLDWELSTIGDPIADFAYHAMAWHLEPHLFRGFAGVIASTPGLPTLADYVTAYERRTESIPMEHWRFYIVFSMFRLAGILFGISQRARAGNAASHDAQSVGSRALPVAARAWELANTSEALL